MLLKCWVIAAIVGFMSFSAGILIVAAFMYLTTRGERASVGLRSWMWLDKVKSSLSDKGGAKKG
jgi:hypothetical protein